MTSLKVCIVGHCKDKWVYKGCFVKIGNSIKFEDFLVREQALLRKSKTSRKSPDKWTFLSLAFYNAPSLQTVDSPELLSLWIFRTIQRFPGSCPDFPPRKFPGLSRGQPLSLRSLTPSDDPQKFLRVTKELTRGRGTLARENDGNDGQVTVCLYMHCHSTQLLHTF